MSLSWRVDSQRPLSLRHQTYRNRLSIGPGGTARLPERPRARLGSLDGLSSFIPQMGVFLNGLWANHFFEVQKIEGLSNS